MREQKFHIYLDSHERTILLHSLVELKNQLLAQGRYADCVDELIFKATGTPLKKLKVQDMKKTDDELEQVKGDFVSLLKDLTSSDLNIISSLNDLIGKLEG